MSAENFDQALDGNDIEVSMVDVLEEQAQLQEDATAVLGGGDENNCTYPLGYVQRQALYACATCSPSEAAGICLACSYRCHEDHIMYELYTKRSFRCDCGNSKFSGNKCKFVEFKDDVNEENKYNHNFNGLYCTCEKPYPDPEDDIEDEMIQCIVCEDWFHGRHLNASVLDSGSYKEMVCADCMEKHSFLWAYQANSLAVGKLSEQTTQNDVNVETTNNEPVIKDEQGTAEPLSADTTSCSTRPPSNTEKLTNGNGKTGEEVKTEALAANEEVAGKSFLKKRTGDDATANGSEDATSSKRRKLEAGEGNGDHESPVPCLLQELRQREGAAKRAASFWQDGWRQKLCTCSRCMDLYRDKGLEFLLDPGDTIDAHVQRANPAPSEAEITQSALSQMNHVQKIEMIRGMNDMTTGLKAFLGNFAAEGKTVGPEDIRSFFADLEKKKKKERLGGVQYFCK